MYKKSNSFVNINDEYFSIHGILEICVCVCINNEVINKQIVEKIQMQCFGHHENHEKLDRLILQLDIRILQLAEEMSRKY